MEKFDIAGKTFCDVASDMELHPAGYYDKRHESFRNLFKETHVEADLRLARAEATCMSKITDMAASELGALRSQVASGQYQASAERLELWKCARSFKTQADRCGDDWAKKASASLTSWAHHALQQSFKDSCSGVLTAEVTKEMTSLCEDYLKDGHPKAVLGADSLWFRDIALPALHAKLEAQCKGPRDVLHGAVDRCQQLVIVVADILPEGPSADFDLAELPATAMAAAKQVHNVQ